MRGWRAWLGVAIHACGRFKICETGTARSAATDTNDAVVDRKEVHFTVLPPPPA